jgi:hypothetical protein
MYHNGHSDRVSTQNSFREVKKEITNGNCRIPSLCSSLFKATKLKRVKSIER